MSNKQEWTEATLAKEWDRMKVDSGGKAWPLRENQQAEITLWATGKDFDKSWLRFGARTDWPDHFFSQTGTKDMLTLTPKLVRRGSVVGAGERGTQMRRAVASTSGLDELGQTNTPVVGKNFAKAITKAVTEMRNQNFKHLVPDLKSLGFVNLANRLEPLVKAATKKGPLEPKVAVWKALAHAYTLEDCDDVDEEGSPLCLYWLMNRAIRFDDESLSRWASYIGGIAVAGANLKYPECRHSLAPDDVRSWDGATVYRGFALPPDLVKSYPKGKMFYWQAFVSTSLNREQSLNFATKNAGGATKAYLFTVKIPPYQDKGFDQMYHFLLGSVSAFKEEAEMLLCPFTRFEVVEEPKEEKNVIHVTLRAIDCPLVTSTSFENITVWVNPQGFGPGSKDHELARRTLKVGTPGYHKSKNGDEMKESWGTWTNFGNVPGVQAAIGLFTDPEDALAWLKDEQYHCHNAVHVRIVVSGGCSEKVLGDFFKSPTMPACELMVYCDDVPTWSKVWDGVSRISVTNKEEEVEKFLQYYSYRWSTDGWVPGNSNCDENVTYFYPYKQRKNGGVVYGAGADFQRTTKEGWEKAEGVWPNMPFAPWDK